MFLLIWWIKGAKPRKNKYINYKQLKEQKRKERQEKVEELKLREMGKDGVGKSTVTTKSSKYKRKEKGGLLEIYGKVSKVHPTHFISNMFLTLILVLA